MLPFFFWKHPRQARGKSCVSGYLSFARFDSAAFPLKVLVCNLKWIPAVKTINLPFAVTEREGGN